MTRNKAEQRPKTIHLRDYRPPAFLVDAIDLRFELDEAETRVRALLSMRRNPDAERTDTLLLDGEALELRGLALDGVPLAADGYRLFDDRLEIDAVPARFELCIETALRPQDNTELSGLYRSSGNFCTQCEAEGFRRITYFPDRPDVLARYSTTLVADAERYPVLLSNGNLVAEGETEDGRHWVRWEDPFPKPSYLFALVAGDLACIEDSFVTASGREVALYLYVQAHNIDQCGHAMASLKKAMRWDELNYGREYDLDRYMIVAVDDFNMGAMENKGLNIFNSRYVLARPDTATDRDYQQIEGVIGHEYFHNWSGNRVTCRDWFQLSLKEGFTVFRDQSFSADSYSPGVQRIEDVNLLRNHQFREDAGPMAHPVRPESYVEINNFYTTTVYNKGAEVVRMLHTLLGAEGFRRGCDLYFERHDGQAVTTDDFVRALEDANGVDFTQFRRWYSQAGTPELQVERHFDPVARRYRLHIRQSCPPTPGQPAKQPFHIPLAMALLDDGGRALPLRLAGEGAAVGDSRVLELREAEQSFVFEDIDAEPVPSLLRGFSAPVRLHIDYSDEELAFLLAHDSDDFARWEAGQILARRLLLAAAGGEEAEPDLLIEAFARLLDDARADPAFRALALNLPSETYLSEFMTVIDPDALHRARRELRRQIAKALQDKLLTYYRAHTDDAPYRIDPQSVGRRSLRNLCLGYLLELETPVVYALAERQFHQAGNMTDVLAALTALVDSDSPAAEPALAAFYEKWRDEALVVDKWFSLQATSRRADTLERVQALSRHPAFSLTNPNKVYALLRSFAAANPVHFHRADGAGYAFIGEQVRRLDAINPQVAARLVTAFTQWRRYDAGRAKGMRAELEKILAESSISTDVYEIASKSLES
ncbi:aminopeptidase N [Thiohalobacter sp. IOR34]|uniref:aminopeptidase N n=1 Tax=Thiohalobacter sp. IOR34 TaxID=3057176 RepID=UPI0025B0704E|nr:aminopeptidase N [Thiohalobacter sp. IOR34]WJW74372.1 aminopeptidase N [Thiohalobacter sp. IOR34]